jgi:hypothetical protein
MRQWFGHQTNSAGGPRRLQGRTDPGMSTAKRLHALVLLIPFSEVAARVHEWEIESGSIILRTDAERMAAGRGCGVTMNRDESKIAYLATEETGNPGETGLYAEVISSLGMDSAAPVLHSGERRAP